jgi:hypothetical protein
MIDSPFGGWLVKFEEDVEYFSIPVVDKIL